MAQKNRANMLTDIVTNIFNNIINYITGQNAQDRFVNLLDSTPNILSDKNQADGYVGTDVNNEMISEYYNEFISRADMISKLTANEAVGFKFYQINDAASGARIIQVVADSNISLYSIGLDVATGETGTYDINTDVFTPIVVSGTPTLSQVLTAGNTSGANDIQFDATQGLLFANTSRLREGTIDAGLGGTKGVAQICAVGYELKWEAGRLYVMDGNGLFIRQSLYNFTTTPTATDDTTKGYMVGSLWTLDDGTVYICSDATATAAVWAIGGIPDLQQVTDVGFTTTNKLISDDGASNTSVLNNGVIELTTGLQIVIIDAALVTTAYNVSFPDKITGAETFAMMSDVTAPDIQQVLDTGNTSTTPIKIDNGTGNYVQVNSSNIIMEDSSGNALTIYPDSITIQNPSFGAGTIKATTLANNVFFELPNKAAGTFTFAMTSDITGGVATVSAGTNISVTGTSTAPIINSLSDRYSTTSVTSNTISNGAKTFTVDADLAYIPLQEVLIVNDPTHHMHATVTSYSGTTLVVDVTSHTGSAGPYTSWVLNLDGVPIDAITGVGTVNEIAYFTAGQVIASLAVATYPSLTELSYVKGVGSQVVGTTDTNTLTNKRITARTGTVASAATPTINTDNVDYYSITALAAAITSFTTNLSGTPTIGQTLWISIKDNGTARAITWGASFEASTIALPTTTVISTRLDVAFIWNELTSVWRCVGTC